MYGSFGEGALPEIYNEFLCFRYVELEVVIKTPSAWATCSRHLSSLLLVINPTMVVSSAYEMVFVEGEKPG